ncbi:hypothetical protein [Streptomyces sp. NPDC093093]|uniref:hypothetical protein n=1 Tax=Streptomyces sp. NPDC093093 TaxID=3366025 RepID=UPI003818E84B
MGPFEGRRLAGADAALELMLGTGEVAYVAQGEGGLVGEGGFLEEEHAARFFVPFAGSGEVVFGVEEGVGGGLRLPGRGEGAGVDDPEEGTFAGAGLGVPLALDRGGGEGQGGPGMPEVVCLVRHGADDVSGHRGVVGFGGELHCHGELLLCGRVVSVVEGHPPG